MKALVILALLLGAAICGVLCAVAFVVLTPLLFVGKALQRGFVI